MDETEELRQLRDLRARLIDALPKCAVCAGHQRKRLATAVLDDWGKRYVCDEHRDINQPETRTLQLAEVIRSLGEIE